MDSNRQHQVQSHALYHYAIKVCQLWRKDSYPKSSVFGRSPFLLPDACTSVAEWANARVTLCLQQWIDGGEVEGSDNSV